MHVFLSFFTRKNIDDEIFLKQLQLGTKHAFILGNRIR